MQHSSVKKLFKEQVIRYSKENQYEKLPLFLGIGEWFKKKKFTRKIEICEFGGGNGQLLAQIQKIYPNSSLTNVEIIEDYEHYLVSKKIKFVLDSILDSNFPDKSFDVIIVRDVLHHLIGRSYKETIKNQELALKELKRLVRPDGVIFIEEFINESTVATRAIYHLSWLNTKIGVHLPSTFISKSVIVSFLTSKKLLNMCNLIFGEKAITKKELQIKVRWYFKALHLFGEIKKIILIIQKK